MVLTFDMLEDFPVSKVSGQRTSRKKTYHSFSVTFHAEHLLTALAKTEVSCF